MGLGNLGVGQMLHDLHGVGRVRGPVHRLVDEQPVPTGAHLLDTLTRPAAEQTVTTAQMMIQKAQRRAHGKGMQPQRHLGQFHRHRVFVHAVHAALEHHAANDMPVVKLFGIDGPAALTGIVQNSGPNGVNPLGQGRNIAGNRGLSLGQGGNHAVGQIVHQADQKMPGTHGRVADFQVQQPLGGVEPV